MKRSALIVVCVVFATLTALADPPSEAQRGASPTHITVVFNNLPYDPHLRTSWGFASVISGREQTILFDTGNRGDILLSNMRQLGIDPMDIDIVVLSHTHSDHTGGLRRFLQENPNVTVYVPASFSRSLEQELHGGEVVRVMQPIRLFDGVYSSGTLGTRIKEQALILQSSQGLVIMTGCAHPGIVDMVDAIKRQHDSDIYMIIGGAHLMGKGTRQIRQIVQDLRHLGVMKVALSHCTGDLALAQFRRAWGADFLPAGCGAVIEIPR